MNQRLVDPVHLPALNWTERTVTPPLVRFTLPEPARTGQVQNLKETYHSLKFDLQTTGDALLF